jgi:dTDP-4-dehydrorhamnose 3,5-epimerase
LKFIPTKIPEVILIEPKVIGDDRGFFFESWRKSEFFQNNITHDFVQENHSRSAKGVLRGLHYQTENVQGKLVRVVHGEVFDVAVDLRQSSSTYRCWVGEILSQQNRRMLWVPPGFAHGFYVMSEMAEFIYKCTDYYAPDYEQCILWNDPKIGIDWPFEESVHPKLSDKDLNGLSFAKAPKFP